MKSVKLVLLLLVLIVGILVAKAQITEPSNLTTTSTNTSTAGPTTITIVTDPVKNKTTTTSSTTTGSTTTTATTTTITTATTTSKTTTSAPPTPSGEASLRTYKFADEKNNTCLLVTMKASFTVVEKVVNIGNDSKMDKSKSSCSMLFVNFGSDNWFKMEFKTDNKTFYLYSVNAHVNKNEGSIANQTIGKTALKASYKCAHGITINLSNNITLNATSIQFQPFEVNKNQYGTGDANCFFKKKTTTTKATTEPTTPTTKPTTPTTKPTSPTTKPTTPTTKPTTPTTKPTTPTTKPTTPTTKPTTPTTKPTTPTTKPTTPTTKPTTPTTKPTTAPTTKPAVTTPASTDNPVAYPWVGKSGNTTCFIAFTGIQFRVTYKTTENTTTDAHFNFANTSTTVTSGGCDKNSTQITFDNKADNQTLKLTFTKDKNDYYLSDVDLTFTVTDKFINATDANKVITATKNKLMLLTTNLEKSYSCMSETQVSLKSNSTNTNGVFIRLFDVLHLEAFPPKANYSKESKCFSDMPMVSPTNGDWKLNGSKSPCLRLKTNLTLHVDYLDIMGTLQTAKIPVVSKMAMLLSNSSCSEMEAHLVLDIVGDKSMNLTLTYKNTSAILYALDGVSFTFKSDSKYFPNHKDYGMTKTITGSGLNKNPTELGKSYRCDLTQSLSVQSFGNASDGLTLMMSDTRWEAFKIMSNGSFNTATYCGAETTTIPPKTTHTTLSPNVPGEPNTENITIVDAKDNKTVCLKAMMGLQLRTMYNTTAGKMTEIGFNYQHPDVKYSASCTGNVSEITYTLKSQSIVLTFTNDAKTAYLSGVRVSYTMDKMFPSAQTNATKNFTISGLMKMSANMGNSYSCMSHETDILVDKTMGVIVRITGVKLQAFQVKNNKFSNVSSCYADKPAPSANTGVWSINDTKKHECAKYMFSLIVNITYPTILGKTETVQIALANNTDYGGQCQREEATLWVQMDDLTFFFFFNNTGTDKDSEYYMEAMMIQYNETSNYFPNHDLREEDGRVTLLNDTLNLFRTDEDHSYKCVAETMASLNFTVVTFAQVQIQPFGIEDSGGFSAVSNCKGDDDSWGTAKIAVVAVVGALVLALVAGGVVFACRKRKTKNTNDCATDEDLSPIIPIIVGAVLAVLIVLVIVAYFVGRARSKGAQYETI